MGRALTCKILTCSELNWILLHHHAKTYLMERKEVEPCRDEGMVKVDEHGVRPHHE